MVLTPPGAAEGETLAVYVDPHTARVTGALPLAHGEPPVQNWLRTFHGDLQLGTVGAIYSEFAASWLPVLFLGGIVIWIGKRRARRRDLIIPAPSTNPGRARMMNWRGSTGIWLTAALVVISLTGLTWSTFAGERVTTVLTALDARAPTVSATVPEPAPGSAQITAGAAEATGRAAGPQCPLTLTPPADPGGPFLVAETSRRGRFSSAAARRLPTAGPAHPHRNPVRPGQRDRHGPRHPRHDLLGLPHVVAAPAHRQGAARPLERRGVLRRAPSRCCSGSSSPPSASAGCCRSSGSASRCS